MRHVLEVTPCEYSCGCYIRVDGVQVQQRICGQHAGSASTEFAIGPQRQDTRDMMARNLMSVTLDRSQ